MPISSVMIVTLKGPEGFVQRISFSEASMSGSYQRIGLESSADSTFHLSSGMRRSARRAREDEAEIGRMLKKGLSIRR